MKKYRVPTGMQIVTGFIYHYKGKAINHCVRNNVPFDKIEEFEEEE